MLPPYRDVKYCFSHEKFGLDPSIGYILAMNRSNFINKKTGNDEGLWQMSTGSENVGVCNGDALSDRSQKCAAVVAALYFKSLLHGVFDGDVLYAVAAVGKTRETAADWKTSLSGDLKDFWNAIKSDLNANQIVRFFAGGHRYGKSSQIRVSVTRIVLSQIYIAHHHGDLINPESTPSNDCGRGEGI